MKSLWEKIRKLGRIILIVWAVLLVMGMAIGIGMNIKWKLEYAAMTDEEKAEYDAEREQEMQELHEKYEREEAEKEAEKQAKAEEKQRKKEEERAAKEAEKQAKEEEKQRKEEEARAAKEAEEKAKEEEKRKKDEEAKAAEEAARREEEERQAELEAERAALTFDFGTLTRSQIWEKGETIKFNIADITVVDYGFVAMDSNYNNLSAEFLKELGAFDVSHVAVYIDLEITNTQEKDEFIFEPSQFGLYLGKYQIDTDYIVLPGESDYISPPSIQPGATARYRWRSELPIEYGGDESGDLAAAFNAGGELSYVILNGIVDDFLYN